MKPEMLLWLARRLGLWVPGIEDGQVVYAAYDHAEPIKEFAPHTDRAQFADVLLWAAKSGLTVTLYADGVFVLSHVSDDDYFEQHDSTDGGCMRAAIEAICLAGGWEGEGNA